MPERFVFPQSDLLEKGVKLRHRIDAAPLDQSETVGDEVEWAFRHFPWIEQLEGSGGRVPGIGEGGQAGLVPLAIHLHESLVGHEDLTANLQHLGNSLGVFGQDERNGANGSHVAGDDIAGAAVSPGRGVVESTVPIDEGYGDTVDLRLDRYRDSLRIQPLLEALEEVDDLLFSRRAFARLGLDGTLLFLGDLEKIVDAEHRDRMVDLLETLDGLTTDPFGRAVGICEEGILVLQFLQFAEELIVFPVRDLRGSFLVVESIVAFDLGGQAGHFDLGIGGRQGLGHRPELPPKPVGEKRNQNQRSEPGFLRCKRSTCRAKARSSIRFPCRRSRSEPGHQRIQPR